MKRVFALVLALSMVFVFVACAKETKGSTSTPETGTTGQTSASEQTATQTEQSSTDAPQKTYRIGFATKNRTNPMQVYLASVIEEEVKKLGYEIVTFDANQDTMKEANNVEDMIADKVDFIFLAPLDYNASAVLVDRVLEAGIPIGILDSGVTNLDKATFAVMSDNKAAGAMAMENLAKAMGYKGKMVIYENSLNYATRLRSQGRDEVLAKYPDIEVVNRVNEKLAVDVAMKAMDNFLQADPDITGGWSGNDLGAQGFVSALQAAGKKPGDVAVVGIDAAEDSITLIKQGWQTGSVAQSFGKLGRTAVQLMDKALKGEKIEPQTVLIPVSWVDQSNADTYVRD